MLTELISAADRVVVGIGRSRLHRAASLPTTLAGSSSLKTPAALLCCMSWSMPYPCTFAQHRWEGIRSQRTCAKRHSISVCSVPRFSSCSHGGTWICCIVFLQSWASAWGSGIRPSFRQCLAAGRKPSQCAGIGGESPSCETKESMSDSFKPHGASDDAFSGTLSSFCPGQIPPDPPRHRFVQLLPRLWCVLLRLRTTRLWHVRRRRQPYGRFCNVLLASFCDCF